LSLVAVSRKLRATMSSEALDRPRVAAPPPLVYLVAIVIGAALERVWRGRLPTGRWGTVLGTLLIAAAIALFAWALREFQSTDSG
jgi:protein-S-isoprenylcysteine O-methyltransferase Ste14